MSDRDIEGWSEINTQSDRIAFLRERWPDLVRRIEREALRSEPTLDEGLREAIGLVLRMEDEGRLEDRSGTGALDDLRAALAALREGETT